VRLPRAAPQQRAGADGHQQCCRHQHKGECAALDQVPLQHRVVLGAEQDYYRWVLRTLTLEGTRGPRGSTSAEGHRKDAEPSPCIVDSRRVCLLIEFFTRQGKREDPAACAVDRSPCRDEQIFTQRCRCRVNGPFHGKLHEEPAGLRVISV